MQARSPDPMPPHERVAPAVRRVVAWVALGLAPGCGGAPATTAGSHEQAATPVATRTPTAPPEGTDAAATPAPSEAAQVLAAVLDDPRVRSHLHLDAPGRSPLRVADGGHVSGRPEQVAGVPITWVSDARGAFAIQELAIEGARADLTFELDVEGIFGVVQLTRGASAWEVTEASITERATRRETLHPSVAPASFTACGPEACTVVRNDCCDAWSVSVSVAPAAEAEMNRRRSVGAHAKPGDMPCRRSCADPGRPVCEEGRCMLAKPDP